MVSLQFLFFLDKLWLQQTHMVFRWQDGVFLNSKIVAALRKHDTLPKHNYTLNMTTLSSDLRLPPAIVKSHDCEISGVLLS